MQQLHVGRTQGKWVLRTRNPKKQVVLINLVPLTHKHYSTFRNMGQEFYIDIVRHKGFVKFFYYLVLISFDLDQRKILNLSEVHHEHVTNPDNRQLTYSISFLWFGYTAFMSQKLDSPSLCGWRVSVSGFFRQALVGILWKLVVAHPHLLPPDAKPSRGTDGKPLRS